MMKESGKKKNKIGVSFKVSPFSKAILFLLWTIAMIIAGIEGFAIGLFLFSMSVGFVSFLIFSGTSFKPVHLPTKSKRNFSNEQYLDVFTS